MSAHLGPLPLSGSHHGGHGSFVDTLLRGFAWRTGSDVAHSLFRLAPTLFLAIVGVVLVVVAARWLRKQLRREPRRDRWNNTSDYRSVER